MAVPDSFPYLQQLIVHDAFAIRDVSIPVFQGGEFKHLILTGRNGSGKTTILWSLAANIQHVVSSGFRIEDQIRGMELLLRGEGHRHLEGEIQLLKATTPVFGNGVSTFSQYPEILVAFFPASRKTQMDRVTAPSVEEAYVQELSKPKGDAKFASHFKQYLVNKKVAQALGFIEGKLERTEPTARFFENFEASLRKIFEDDRLHLEFVSEEYEFYLRFGDGRRITFNQLSAGFSAFLNILTDLLMRIDLLRRQKKDHTFDPRGFVIIDEPETHLHLEMQYQILPTLTGLFPNLQFIAATHSPAVASSITGATVFDLTTRKALGDEAAGSSFSELMQTHFGLENQYSNVADEILAEVAAIDEMQNRTLAIERLRQVIEEKGRYMSPVLHLDIQARLSRLMREFAT